MTTTRQRYCLQQHISSENGRIAPLVRVADNGIAVVELIDGFAVQSDEPDTLRFIAAAFWNAADQLEAQAAL